MDNRETRVGAKGLRAGGQRARTEDTQQQEPYSALHDDLEIRGKTGSQAFIASGELDTGNRGPPGGFRAATRAGAFAKASADRLQL
jgi:hypothetical protein